MEQDSSPDGLPERLALDAMRRPHRMISAWGLALILALAGLSQLEIDTSTASFLDRDHPAWADYQRSLERHGGDEFLVIALEGQEPWDRRLISELIPLSAKIAALPAVRRVDSLATVPLMRAGADGLRLDSGLADGVPDTEAGWANLIAQVRSDRIARGSLVSADERVFALNVMLDSEVDGDRAATVDAVRQLVSELPARITGVPVFRTEVNARTRSELMIFVPITLALLCIVIALAVPRIVAVFAPVCVGAVAAAAALGCMGALSVPLSLSTTILPSMLLGLGCAYAMHVVTARHAPAFESSVLRIARPIALSGLTTAIGFVAMATVPIDAIRELATYGALGVLIATLASLTLAPALLILNPVGSAGRSLDQWIRSGLRDWLVRLVTLRRGLVLASWTVAFIGAGVGLARLDVATDIILWFPEGGDIRDDYELIREQLSGITPVNVLIESEGEDAPDVRGLEVLAAIDALAADLQARDDVGKALSVADPLRVLSGVFKSDGLESLPGSGAEIEQYLLVLSGVRELDDVLHPDRRSANIVLRVDDNSSRDIVAMGDWVDDWWSRRGVPGFRVTTTGIMYEFGRAEESIAHGQIKGLVLAAITIGIILLLVLRHLRVATLALLVNLIPIAIGFGVLGLLRIPLDAATVCLGSMALGIAVDDTIHVVTTYGGARGHGASPRSRLVETLTRVLPALVLSTAAISLGFAVLGLSGFTLIRNLGFVTAGLVVLCLLADLTLLPAMLVGPRAGVDEECPPGS